MDVNVETVKKIYEKLENDLCYVPPEAHDVRAYKIRASLAWAFREGWEQCEAQHEPREEF